MKRFLTIFLFAAPALYAQGNAPTMEKNPVSLLPDGSVLKGVLLPRYDKERNLVGDMKTEIMTLLDSERVHGQNVRIRFFNTDSSLRGKVEMKHVLLNQTTSRLYSNEPVEITSDRLVASGGGLVYSLSEGEGFLKGPASTRISAPPSATSSNSVPPHAAALVVLCAAPTQQHSAQPPSPISEEQSAAKSEMNKHSSETEASFNESVKQGEKASAAAFAFISSSEIKNIATNELPGEMEAKPLEVEPGHEDTVITSDDGMYFDSDEGVFVYFGNVKVIDPRFNLSGAQQLKIFFAKKPEKQQGTKDGKAPAGIGNFSDVQKIIAEGAVLIDQKGVAGKEAIQAGGRILTYNIPTGEIIIHGGYPWVKQGAYFARAKEPNLTLRLLNNGSFSTQGNWEMGGNLNRKGN